VYVLNEDGAGRKAVLFPIGASDPAKPLAAKKTKEPPHVLPSAEDRWRVDTSAGAEDVIVVASPEPLVELVEEIAALPRAGGDVKHRGILGLDSSVDASGLASAARSGRLADVVQALADRSETVSGVYVRRIRLENPEGR
jgi:hypothetical protein